MGRLLHLWYVMNRGEKHLPAFRTMCKIIPFCKMIQFITESIYIKNSITYQETETQPHRMQKERCSMNDFCVIKFWCLSLFSLHLGLEHTMRRFGWSPIYASEDLGGAQLFYLFLWEEIIISLHAKIWEEPEFFYCPSQYFLFWEEPDICKKTYFWYLWSPWYCSW